ncbi:MAG: DUF4982 domain-containing protein [Bacteroidetes bacterium]|uniref:DUF4982 domain-containing protein n=1 Tax=Candidatus Cryptobacteroides excrementipullorum TaxID=2840761 RepID=A0A9D9IUH9_9BACT|nr:DUF4982 domain-containing protein [Candidatus Cryptobacteroides excrementipullorum]
MKIRLFAALVVAVLGSQTLSAQRQVVSLDEDWQFRFSHSVEKGVYDRVDLPHTWNAGDALSGKPDYKRGIGNYRKTITVPDDWKGKRVFIRFEGVNNVADMFVNGCHAGRHKGGYGAFTFDLTDGLRYGAENTFLVRVSNAENLEIMPLVGDFNFYGGIYRNVSLIVAEPVHISMRDYGSSGVRLVQKSVSRESAQVDAVVQLSNDSGSGAEAELRVRLLDGEKEVLASSSAVSLPAGESSHSIGFSLENPHLWNGTEDPFLYTAEVSLWQDGRMIDRVEQPLGLRYYSIDPEKGFFLNGRHLQLRGVCRHQDRAEVGNALRPWHHDEDAAIMAEMGVNAVRLAHYPQSSYFYDLMDRYGFIVWAEIPFIGPGGYSDEGFVDIEAFRENGKEQLREMIRQHYNHPSICLWGIFNELSMRGDSPVPYIEELDAIAHEEDPTRPTTSASNIDGELNFVTDAIAWNRYDGWYGGTPADLGKWLDRTHEEHPELCIAISEYGAGASIYHQQDTVVKSVPVSWWHPENWQTQYHIENWRELSSRPFVWGSFVWNMFDFGAAHRHEGDRPGINDKGLVTFDRKVRKDAFYFYQANWRDDIPVLYLADRRCTERVRKVQTFRAFTNFPEAELFVNGRSCGKAGADSLRVVTWENVELSPGRNEIKVVAGGRKNTVEDSYECYLQTAM